MNAEPNRVGLPAGTAQVQEPYRVIVVDDSAVIRGLIARWLETDEQIAVVGSASNGEQAIKTLGRQPADVIILDIEMPVMDGLTALPKLLEASPGVKVVMASTLTLKNAEISVRAMSLGAADYLPKPTSTRDSDAIDVFRRELLEKVKALGAAARQSSAKGVVPRPVLRESKVAEKAPSGSGLYGAAPIILRKPSMHRPHVLAIGSSTGGPQALFKVLGDLDGKLRVPVLITQHMPATFTTILAEHITRISKVPCQEGETGTKVEPGRIYLAPGDHHMTVARSGTDVVLKLNQDPPENFCRPAVDVMLRTMVPVYGPNVLTVILTGMGHDGLAGGQEIVKAGGSVVAQDEESSVVWGMPGAVATGGLCSAVVPLDDMAATINKFMVGGV